MLRPSSLNDVQLIPTVVPSINGSQKVSSRTLHRTETSSLDVWEYDAGEFEWRVHVDQTTSVLAGSATVEFADGREVSLNAGDAFYLPEGLHGRWTVINKLRLLSVTTP